MKAPDRYQLAAAAVVWLIAGSCSAGSGFPTAKPSSPPLTVGATSIPAPSTSTPSSIPTATTLAVEVAPQPSPDQAAAALLDAWRNGDRPTALRVASVAAVNTLFARPPTATSARGCQVPIGAASDCAFGTDGSHLIVLHTIAVPSGLWVVDRVTLDS